MAAMALSVPGWSIPPPPPAQSGSSTDLFDCGRVTLIVRATFDRRVRRGYDYKVELNGKTLSARDAARLADAIAKRGPFQATSVYCIGGEPYELALHRYTPSEDTLHIYFEGRTIKRIK